MNVFPAEVVFFGDAPGQPEVTVIGGRRYQRGEFYDDVPVEHFSKGGFHVAGELDGMVVVHKTPRRRGIVLGSAPCLMDDFADLPGGVHGIWEYVAVNGAGVLHRTPLDIWASIHGPKLVDWIEKRRALGCDMDFEAYGNFADNQDSAAVIRWNRPNGGGSSGLFAVLIALELGFDKLILCGMPVDGEKRITSDGEVEVGETPYQHYRKGWILRQGILSEHVRSMSGWTRETFGEPTAEWLNT
jgi:hypothetical protein